MSTVTKLKSQDFEYFIHSEVYSHILEHNFQETWVIEVFVLIVLTNIGKDFGHLFIIRSIHKQFDSINN